MRVRAATRTDPSRAWDVVLGGGLASRGPRWGSARRAAVLHRSAAAVFGAGGRAGAGGLRRLAGRGELLRPHLPWTWGRPQRAARAVPWTVFAVLAAFALLDWSSRLALRVLPAAWDQRTRSSRRGSGCSAVPWSCFYAALLHSLHRRPYGWRARWRRGGGGGRGDRGAAGTARGVSRAPAGRRRGRAWSNRRRGRAWCVVAIETATLDAILPLAGQGRLPFFRACSGAGRRRPPDDSDPDAPAQRCGRLWLPASTRIDMHGFGRTSIARPFWRRPGVADPASRPGFLELGNFRPRRPARGRAGAARAAALGRSGRAGLRHRCRGLAA